MPNSGSRHHVDFSTCKDKSEPKLSVTSEMELNPKEPPEFGELRFSLEMPPASRQASTTAEMKVRDAVRLVTRPLEYLLDGYVWISFDWYIHE